MIAFCSVAILLVLIIRRKRINSKPRLPTIPIPIPNQSIIQSPSLSISKPIPPLPNLPLPNLPLPNLPLLNLYPFPEDPQLPINGLMNEVIIGGRCQMENYSGGTVESWITIPAMGLINNVNQYSQSIKLDSQGFNCRLIKALP